MTWKRIVLFVLAAGLVGSAGRVAATPASETPRTVYLSAIDDKGVPVTDLTAADLVVREGSDERAISILKPATEPMDVAILVDDNGGGGYQAAVLQMMQALGAQAKFSMTEFIPQAQKILEYTNDDVAAIQSALDRIVRRGKVQAHGDQLLEGISQSARELQQRGAPRRVILVFTASGEGQTRNPDIVMKELQSTGVALNVVHANGANLGLVTGDGPKQSGGRALIAGSASAVSTAVTKITDALLHQYALTYTLPDGVKPSDRLSVSVSRKGVSLLAPTRIPN